ncbi:metal ABC transporter permease [Streptomyces sp. SID3343]|uniref:metal ABC transporter permease n=1 Tax=Streptomyces sp. SID3343 TaxID=2690260 RepID=UPI001367D00A|nr:metal ABC transporter permease [Streptomyces sp. SID3343]
MDTALLLEPFRIPYLTRALIELTVLGILCGAVGAFVVLRRLEFVADALTHTVFPGVVIGFVLHGADGVFEGALIAAGATAVALTLLTRGKRTSDDAALAVLLTAMFSIGVVVVSRSHSYTADFQTFLFGQILYTSNAQIIETAAVAVLCLATLAVLGRELLLRSFDADFARAAGYRVGALDLALNVVVALTVVAAVRTIGTALVLALLVVPATIGRTLGRRPAHIVAIGIAAAVLCGYLGLTISYSASIDHDLALPTGPTVVLTLVAAYLLALAGAGAARLRARVRVRRTAPATRPEAGPIPEAQSTFESQPSAEPQPTLEPRPASVLRPTPGPTGRSTR